MNMECRLCSNYNSENLWQADPGSTMENTIRWYVLQATGINLHKKSLVPQALCHACVETCIKIYWFRHRSIERDKSLHCKYTQVYKQPVTRYEELFEIPEDEKWIVPDFIKKQDILHSESQSDQSEIELEPRLDSPNYEYPKSETISIVSEEIKIERPDTPEKIYLPELVPHVTSENNDQLPVHTTVKNLLNSNPELNIPETIKKCHINPIIDLSDVQRPSVSKDVFTNNLELAPTQNTNQNMGLMTVDKSDNVYICRTCNRLFTSKKKLATHKKMHFQCTECSAHFPKKFLLNEHTKVHASAGTSIGFVLQTAPTIVQLPSQLVIDNFENNHVKYLMLNRYVHKTQRETQTDNDLLDNPIVRNTSIVFKGLVNELENYQVCFIIKFSSRGLRGSYAVNVETESPMYESFDISGIPVKDIDPIYEPDDIIDLVHSPYVTKKRKSMSTINEYPTVDLTECVRPKKKNTLRSLSVIK